ncbi:hypothetical protein NMY22_g12217 [Coprinellus aureogranulatus]|nr:hypothetical protein NMY22_g12217 [Coprinellus aureogranulatus]
MHTSNDGSGTTTQEENLDIERNCPRQLTSSTGNRTTVELTDQTSLLPRSKVIVSFFALALCMVISTLDQVIVSTALSTVSTHFKAGSVSQWVPSAYNLTCTAFQPFYGRFSDIFGRKKVLCVTLAVFGAANLAAGFSKSIIMLIVLRGVAGSGGGGIHSLSQIIISDIVSLRERGKYQGIIGMFNVLGYAIGPIIGGALAEKVSWRWCFWICVPFTLAAVLVATFTLPLKKVEQDMRTKLQVIDYLGALLVLTGSTLIVLPLIWGGVTFPWKSPVVVVPLITGLAVVVSFCLWEWKRAKLPIVPMHIFKHITVCGVYITMFICGFVYFSMLFYLPQFFQVALGHSPIKSSIFLIPLLVTGCIVSSLAGMMISKTGKYRVSINMRNLSGFSSEQGMKAVIYCGYAIWSVASGLLSTVNRDSSKAQLVIYMLLAGFGSGQTLQTSTIAVQASVDPKDLAVVTAFRNTVGRNALAAISGTIINNTLKSSMSRIQVPSDMVKKVIDDPVQLSTPDSLGITEELASTIFREGYERGFRTVFLLNAGLTAVASIIAFVMIRQKILTKGVHGAQGDEEKGGSSPR